MKSTLDSLNSKDKATLALLYHSDSYKVLQKIHDVEKAGLGQDAIMAPDMTAVFYIRGRQYQSKYLLTLIKDCYKKTEKS